MIVLAEQLEDISEILCSRMIHHVDGKRFSENNSIWYNCLHWKSKFFKNIQEPVSFQLGRIRKNSKGKYLFFWPQKSLIFAVFSSFVLNFFITLVVWKYHWKKKLRLLLRVFLLINQLETLKFNEECFSRIEISAEIFICKRKCLRQLPSSSTNLLRNSERHFWLSIRCFISAKTRYEHIQMTPLRH